MVKIRDLRSELCLTQKQFAERLNLDAHNIGDWERGKGEPNSDMLVNISKTFNVSVDYLLGLEDDFGIKQDVASPIDLEDLNLLKKLKALSVYTQNAFKIQIEAMYEKEVLNFKGERI